MNAAPRGAGLDRPRRWRDPLLLAFAALFAFETLGGLVLFTARLVAGAAPGEALHVIGGGALALVYVGYQIRHWARVAPLRPRLEYTLGLLAAAALVFTLTTGTLLAWPWWRDRVASSIVGPVRYAAALVAAHDVAAMLALTFVGAHVGAMLLRDRRRAS